MTFSLGCFIDKINKQQQERISVFFCDFKTGSLWPLLYYLIFILRRFIIANAFVYLQGYGLFQIITYIYTSLLSIAYILGVKPYNDMKMNIQELFNELCLLVISVLLLFFTDICDYPDLQDYIGWYIIIILVVNIALNILFVVVITLHSLYKVFSQLIH